MADRALRIAIDGRELIGKRTGVGTYLGEILREWQTPEFPHELVVIVPASPDQALRDRLPRVRWTVRAHARAGTIWEQTTLPASIRDAAPEVFFAPAYTAPVRLKCPLVVTIHDVSYFAHPEWFSRREGWRRRWLTRATARRAARIIAVSAFTRSEIEKYLHIPPDRIVIASPWGPQTVADDPGSRAPVVLFVGSLFNRRRIPDLIHGFAHIAARIPDARLMLVGDNRTSPRIDPRAVAAEAGVADRVEWREYASDAERDALYRSARVFAFVSDYEGFGIPPLEALAHGVPPIVLDTAVSREVYGDAALRVPPSVEAIGDAMARLLTDDKLRAQVLRAGRERLAAHTWSTTAATVRRVLEEAAR